jgi:hypothetical protein
MELREPRQTISKVLDPSQCLSHILERVQQGKAHIEDWSLVACQIAADLASAPTEYPLLLDIDGVADAHTFAITMTRLITNHQDPAVLLAIEQAVQKRVPSSGSDKAWADALLHKYGLASPATAPPLVGRSGPLAPRTTTAQGDVVVRLGVSGGMTVPWLALQATASAVFGIPVLHDRPQKSESTCLYALVPSDSWSVATRGRDT